ncbi:MAG: amino acid--tRNA ligase-related protein, partial [Gemmatimonadaceae bacterium]
MEDVKTLLVRGLQGFHHGLLVEDVSMALPYNRRTHKCGELRGTDAGKKVLLAGWVDSHRDHGGMLFVNLRDYTGLTQLRFDPQNTGAHGVGAGLRSEDVIAITGSVVSRGTNINAKMPTGEIEVVVEQCEVLSKSEPPPIEVSDKNDASEELRLKHRYLDLRRPAMQRVMRLRHTVAKTIRDYFDANGFVEIETPFLTKSTPEGARDYLVPSRVKQGSFYALPQSPQIFKQLFMVAGFERYAQIVRCFRDEDLRADRQPEFTQLDME